MHLKRQPGKRLKSYDADGQPMPLSTRGLDGLPEDMPGKPTAARHKQACKLGPW